MGTSLEVAHVFREHGRAYRCRYRDRLGSVQIQAMHAIEQCRTSVLGGHVYECPACGHRRNAYNSCRNRHCPKCQWLDRERWLETRREDLLPVGFFHVVFTLPEELRGLARNNPKSVYGLLFECASETLKELGADARHLGAKIGVLAVLHTWSQKLLHHPHLHCVVTGGGLSGDGHHWIPSRGNFFAPVWAISRLFRGKFLTRLKSRYRRNGLRLAGSCKELEDPERFQALIDTLFGKEWVVYCQAPFGSARRVLAYLGRYAHRVAISNDRLLGYDGENVSFSWRDSENTRRRRRMTVTAEEFVRRFLLHVLPRGFVRIRSYGLFANRYRRQNLECCRILLDTKPFRRPPRKEPWDQLYRRLSGRDPLECPHCSCGHLCSVKTLPRAPPWSHCDA